MDGLKKGDRVLVVVPFCNPRRQRRFTGTIIGEARDGHAWQIVKDGTKWPRGVHKSFCAPEVDDDSGQEKSTLPPLM
jgi:hypothetical protein